MSENRNIKFRIARNQVIYTSLSFTPYPINDLDLGASQYSADYNSTIEVILPENEPGVTYEFYQDEQKISPSKIGTGEQIEVTSNKLLDEDDTISILALNTNTGLQSKLLQSIHIKTGVDTGLTVYSKNSKINYNETASVIIKSPQPHVNYQLTDTNKKVVSEVYILDENFKGKQLTLTSIPLTEDTELTVHAASIKTLLEGDLKQKVMIQVYPNPDLSIELEKAFTDFNTSSTLRIKNTQASANYQLKVVGVYDPLASLKEVTMGANISGKGGDVALTTDKLTDDILFEIIATKIDSGLSLSLLQPVRVRVLPDPTREVSVKDSSDSLVKAYVRIYPSQQGVSYQLVDLKNDTLVGGPVAHHWNLGIFDSKAPDKSYAQVQKSFGIWRDSSIDEVLLPVHSKEPATEFNVIATKLEWDQSLPPAQVVMDKSVSVK